MRQFSSAHLITLAILATSVASHAQSGMTVPYTGEIRLDNGWLADAVVPMTVTLYDAVEGGNAVFQEEHSSVVVEAGIFELVLGSIGDLGSIDWTQSLYLAVSVYGSAESEPREPIMTTELSGTFGRALVLSGRVASAATTAEQADLATEAVDVTGRDIHPATVSITGIGEVINAAGEWVGSAVGMQGPTGPSGPSGPSGAAGEKGDAGPAGADGVAGATGPQGETGPAGADGVAGATGPQGEAGSAGADGAAGATGPQGPLGETGPAGANGTAGATGPQGDKGDTGAAGATGPQGETGPAGADGAAGATGPQGDQGDTGAAGSTGPQGDQGDQGDQGTQGVTGPQGDQGNTGATGATGPQGDQRDQGD